ncbi:PepSY domain-containing protein [Pleionea sediminis]|uniref:PepSY domain-containing protein n=1 Tax=Pleionea sediminis TaxID=2569479 RepID=UPI0011867C6F|nr:PepSY domain-containing protein [Pleionea sediminis]
MKNILSSQVIQRSLLSHSLLGLSISALLFLICFTGTLVVLFEEFERWEQPDVEEYSDYSVEQITVSVAEFERRVESIPESLYVVLPTEEVPRMHISGDGKEWFINRDGSLGDSPQEGWTHFLKELHVSLHLPETIGLIIVGIFGALLFGMVITGILAHPKIFKDAFRWRKNGSLQLAQTDLHNRLSVWGTPFYIMIGLTGAFIGLVGLFVAVTASAFYDGNRQAVIDTVYGADPEVSQSVSNIDYQAALNHLEKYAPKAEPIYFVIQNKGTEQQFLEIAARLPERLIYSELYRFKSNGELINHQGMSDGDIGRQVAYSVYRLHFGHFAGLPIKLLYVLLGLCLTVVCASGVNIWLTKRKHESFINDLWVGVVWGLPLAIVGAAFSVFLSASAMSLFLMVWLLGLIIALTLKAPKSSRRVLQFGLCGVLLLIPILHWIKYQISFGVNVSTVINLGMILTSLWLWGLASNRFRWQRCIPFYKLKPAYD